MKIMTCPVNGPRPVSEFACAGELRDMPDPAVASDAEWAGYVFNRNGTGGVKREWWCHTASGVWFVAERDTLTDVVIRTYLFGQGGAAIAEPAHSSEQNAGDARVAGCVGPPSESR